MAGQEIAIVGAGVIGLALALELADAGCRVTVFERGRAMEQASWAAAGMLAVDDPENPPELLPLSRLSRELYPGFLHGVETLSGQCVPFRTSQTLQAIPRGEPGALGASADMLPGLLTDRYRWMVLEEASLDPRDLCAALPIAAARVGVSLREHTAIERIEASEGCVAFTAETNGERLFADHCILAGGAWAARPDLPVAPRKGQMIEVTLNGPALPFTVRSPELYLVPRGDGRVAIGATVEYAGFDRSIDEEAGDRLWQAASELWPPVLQGRITARWTGLRPGLAPHAADALPVLGPLDDTGRLWAAAAHFRNGILLAPATARVLRQMLFGEEPSVSLARFAPARFVNAAG